MKKRNITIFSLLLIFSLLVSMGAAIALDASISKETGHRFIEESWGINYDVLSGKLVEDYTPGDYADELNDTGDDPTPFVDANYYIAYINLGQVQTLFMALESQIVYGLNGLNYTGCAPYQIMQQHFRTPSGDHVLVQNSFAGLVAYQENDVVNGVPDRNDSLYYGDSLHSQYHKWLFNNRLKLSLGGERPIDESISITATPVLPERTEVGDEISYKFGMNYENLFIVWHNMNEDVDFGNITDEIDLIGKAVAFTSLAYLNFSYTITGTLVEDRPINITTTTEYDIGPITDLWIINDDETYTNSINGTFYNIGLNLDISRYDNATTIEDRLDGDETHLGFGLAVSNYARISVIAATVEEQEGSTVVDDANRTVDGATADYNVTRLNLRTRNKPSFEIDFESKPDYILGGGGDPILAPVKLYPSVRLRANAINRIDGLAVNFLNTINKRMIQSRIDYANERFDLEGKRIEIDVARRNILYAICFPEWSGKSIYQDPTFTAFVDPSNLLGFLSKIDGYTPFLIGIIGVISISLLVRKYKKNK
ncbi:hypothetical protein DSAG12_03735 [Promethearchaeum syntrophicum]|uniref:Uncharacterized protein n=1 Tax=Promethearchaeum syntrophicum TaxID=2594042 RepID=A0A5B9DGV9_9ARCH